MQRRYGPQHANHPEERVTPAQAAGLANTLDRDHDPERRGPHGPGINAEALIPPRSGPLPRA